MSTWVMVAFGCAGILALLFLYLAGPKQWYWHVLSAVVAVGIGLVPVPTKLNTPQGSLVIGFIFVFLLIWGIAAPFFLKRRRRA